MCQCGNHSGPNSVSQTLDELEFERGLWFAAQYNDLDRVSYLLDKGFQVDKPDVAGYTALHYASRNGHLVVCRTLLERGACVDAKTRQGQATSLHRAAAAGHLDIVKYLLERKANVRLKDADGKTVLHRAAANKHFDICKHLIAVEPALKNEEDAHKKKPVDYVQSTPLQSLLT